MCGIHCLLGIKTDKSTCAIASFNKMFGILSHRGPDDTRSENIDKHTIFGFHRRMICGLSSVSDEPLHAYGYLTLVCNGEIYNHTELKSEYGDRWEVSTSNDCEVILHLYHMFGIEKTMEILDGEFAFVLHDSRKNKIYMVRDHMGVRPLYRSFIRERGSFDIVAVLVASEMQGVCAKFTDDDSFYVEDIVQVEPRYIHSFDCDGYDPSKVERIMYYEFPKTYVSAIPTSDDTKEYERSDDDYDIHTLGKLFDDAVRKRVHPKNSEVPIAFTLSGGLDSTAVTCTGVRILRDEFGVDPATIRTYCIGKRGSPDLKAAQTVADYLGTNHASVIVSDDDMIGVIRDVIQVGGTFCRTSIRAMVPHYLVSKRIADDKEPIVVMSGEAADETWGSYGYFGYAPSEDAFAKEVVYLCENIHMSDGLRADRCVAAHGLELRVPFTDRPLVDYTLHIHPKHKMFSLDSTSDRIEKYPLRMAMISRIPDDVRMRRKNGFSDSVSASGDSWVDALVRHIDVLVSDDEFAECAHLMTPFPPLTKESYYYRKIFREFFGKDAESACMLIRHEEDGTCFRTFDWMPHPKWCPGVTDPSGRQGLHATVAD